MKKLSFIIPVYNSEKYLARCLDSILNQVIEDVELIIVNDGSTDSSLSIAETYASKHNIKIINKNNSGPGATRNIGINAATGDYIWCVDSDDWLEESILPRLMKVLQTNDPDVIICNFTTYFAPDNQVINDAPPGISNRLITLDEISDKCFASFANWKITPWRQIIKRSVLNENNIRFPEAVHYEDHPFAAEVLYYARTLYFDAPPVLVYFQHPESLSQIKNSMAFDFIKIRKTCLGLYRQYGWDKKFIKAYMNYLLPEPFFAHHVTPESQKEFLNALRPEITDENINIIKAELKQNYLFKRFLHAVQSNSVGTYKLTKIVYEKLNKIYSFNRKISNLSVKVAKKIHRYLPFKFKLLLKNTKWYVAPPSTPMHNVIIDVRNGDKNRPYVFAQEDSDLCCRCVFELGKGRVNFGRRCSVGNGTTLICTQENGITIGNNVMISWGCTIVDNNSHMLDPVLRHNDAWHWKIGMDKGTPGLYKDWSGIKRAPVFIDDDAWVGFGSTILSGINIGRGAIVGAQSVVSRNVPPYTIFAGNPARFVRIVPRSTGWQWLELVEALKADNVYGQDIDIQDLKNIMTALLKNLKPGESCLVNNFPRSDYSEQLSEDRLCSMTTAVGNCCLDFSNESFLQIFRECPR